MELMLLIGTIVLGVLAYNGWLVNDSREGRDLPPRNFPGADQRDYPAWPGWPR